MKSIIFLFFLSSSLCSSQIINFPDANFKNKLLANGVACIGSSIAGCVPGPIDINGNGEIEVSEAESVAVLSVSSANISNLSGIEYFTNLEQLNCIFNNLTTINISALTQLKVLNLRRNFLTSIDLTNQTLLETLSFPENLITTLDVSHQPLLKSLFCNTNQLNGLDFSNNPLLERVYCGGNLLTVLDFSNNPTFFDLGCRNNPNLTTIKIRNGITQLFAPNTWFNECWNNIPNLNYICADSSEINALQSFLAGCGVTQAITIDSACPLSVNDYDLNSLTVYPNPSDGVFQVDFTSLVPSAEVAFSVYDILGKKLFEKKVTFNDTGFEVNLVDYPKGVYQLRICVGETVVNKKLVKK